MGIHDFGSCYSTFSNRRLGPHQAEARPTRKISHLQCTHNTVRISRSNRERLPSMFLQVHKPIRIADGIEQTTRQTDKRTQLHPSPGHHNESLHTTTNKIALLQRRNPPTLHPAQWYVNKTYSNLSGLRLVWGLSAHSLHLIPSRDPTVRALSPHVCTVAVNSRYSPSPLRMWLHLAMLGSEVRPALL